MSKPPTLEERQKAMKAGKPDPIIAHRAALAEKKPQGSPYERKREEKPEEKKAEAKKPEPKEEKKEAKKERPQLTEDMKNKPKVVIRGALGLETSPIFDLQDLQGDFKTLEPENEAKLKKELITVGFCEPFTVAKLDGKLYLLNGHQRAKVLRKMTADGIVPKDLRFPCRVVPVKDKSEAVRICLALTSQYGTVTKKGLARLCKTAKVSLGEAQASFNFPDLSLAALKDALAEEQGAKSEAQEAQKEAQSKKVKFQKCPKCGHTFDPKAPK